MTRLVVCQGIVLGKRVNGEANASVFILSEHAGLVSALARSSRKGSSKLRYGLEPWTQGRFSLVRGKAEWKVTGVENISRPLMYAPLYAQAAAGRITKLLIRLIQGEECAPVLFFNTLEGFSFLARAQSREEAESIECVLVLRILFALGYLPKTAELAPFLEEEGLSIQTAAISAASRSRLIKAINESLTATGL